MPDFVNYDGTEITKLLLFGTNDVPLNFNERVREVDAPIPTITYDSDEFLEDGGGRYAWVARANLVEFFLLSTLTSRQVDRTQLMSYWLK